MPMKYREEPPNRLFGTSGVRGVVHKDLSIGLLYDLAETRRAEAHVLARR